MDHMGFLKHLRKYKAEIGSLKATIGNLERDIDILTGNRDYWRERYEQTGNLEKFIESMEIKDNHIKRLKQSSLDYQRAFEYMSNQNKLLVDQLVNYEADKLILRDMGYKHTRLPVKTEIRRFLKE